MRTTVGAKGVSTRKTKYSFDASHRLASSGLVSCVLVSCGLGVVSVWSRVVWSRCGLGVVWCGLVCCVARRINALKVIDNLRALSALQDQQRKLSAPPPVERSKSLLVSGGGNGVSHVALLLLLRHWNAWRCVVIDLSFDIATCCIPIYLSTFETIISIFLSIYLPLC